MKAKRISQKAVKNMINGNTALLHIGNFNTTYFADYKGGTVSIVEVNTGNYVYTENI